MGQLFSWLQGIFWAQEMEIAILGLQNAGKSSFVQVINTGVFEENMIPTVGFNMHKVQKGKVTIKVWDMGGQKKFRGMWERYCRGVEVIVFVVDANDPKNFPAAYKELKTLLSKPALAHVPLLVLLNKNDLHTAVQPQLVVKELELDTLKNRDVAYYSVSCKNLVNIDKCMEWIIKRAQSNKNRG
mmetsp:Transcript_11544/g.13067  ORF Transcript_11544/g.13067 Transcript_11544/m.13067 type:complete len:185 (+) Transcript_11544:51-605(+)